VSEIANLSAYQFEFPGANPSLDLTELKQFVQTLSLDHTGSMKQKRRTPRSSTEFEVPAVMLDQDYQPVGQPFVAICRNLSAGGLCLVSTEGVSTPHLLVKLNAATDSPIQLVTRVRRCRPIRRYFEIGCEFIHRIAGGTEKS